MKKWLLLLILLLVGAPALGAEIRLSAAASLNEAVRDLCDVYRQQSPESRILANFGGSGSVARQIAEGAPADLFVSASPEWINYLSERGKLAAGTVRSLASNTLVFIGPAATRAASLGDLPALERIAIGSPRSVPAGRYAEQALKAAGIYGRLLTEGKLVMAQDVRQALVYADRGEVDGAFVYKTDALLAKRAKILFEVPGELYDPVTYPFALTVVGARNRAAVSFWEFLNSSEAKDILEKHGFAIK